MKYIDSMVPTCGDGELVRRAAQYVRMSTEHQQYSTSNQAEKIKEYASRRNLEIVRTYADEGKSGLRIDGRAGLQQLLRDVESSADGGGSRMLTRVPTMSMCADAPASKLPTVPSNSKTMVLPSRPL